MKKILLLTGVLLSLGLFCACSNDYDDDVTDSGLWRFWDTRSIVGSVLEIQAENGETETCRIPQSYCGRVGWLVTVCEPNGSNHNVYPIVFTAVIENSSLFNVMQIDYESINPINVEDLKVGTTFKSSELHFRAWQEESVNKGIKWQNSPGATGGQVQVVDKRTAEDGKSYITLSFQDLKLNGGESCCLERDYIFNGTIDFVICENGLYPNGGGIDMESMLMPSDELTFFMMDALHSNESQGRRTFFSAGPEKQECLIINSEEELRAAYKGDKELPQTNINFQYCTLVIGRTYGESGAVSLGGYELKDNGDAYQLDVTLNNNTNPNYAYIAAFVDLYFWKLYPKMEKKPVVFNRIRQDVNLDPLGDESAYARIRNRWILEGYSDADGQYHRVGDGWLGDPQYSIEFMENGRVEGRINDTNDFSCSYMIPYVAKRDYYNDGVDHGVIELWNWNVTEVVDDDPVSQQFMRLPDATQFKMASSFSLAIFVSPKEWFLFRREGM